MGIGTSTPTTGKLVLYGGNFDITNNRAEEDLFGFAPEILPVLTRGM